VIDHTVQTLDGTTTSLASYRGKALLVVNTASQCGYTPQYAGLEALHEAYEGRGLVVLGFPCNDFGAQEPGSAEEIRSFCETRFHVKFPLFAKVHAKGPDKSPLYKSLTEETAEGIRGEVKWNFTKFLVDPQGEVVARFEPAVAPDAPELRAAIEKVLPR
jgi:glutathione peroxidase